MRTDVGVDLICDAADTAALSAALRARGATPVSEEAAECVRIEHGRPRYGIDLDDSVIPQEAGLNERAVSFTKGCYVGQETSRACTTRASPTAICAACACRSQSRRASSCCSASGRSDTSAARPSSPTLGPIALALVRREAEPGSIVTVGEHGASAEVLALPFPSPGD